MLSAPNADKAWKGMTIGWPSRSTNQPYGDTCLLNSPTGLRCRGRLDGSGVLRMHPGALRHGRYGLVKSVGMGLVVTD